MNRTSGVRAALGRIHTLDHDRAGLSAQTWHEVQPVRRLQIGSRTVVLTQPTSTFWVYALGLLTCAVGVQYGSLADGEPVLQLWSIGLWLWGIGALLAGTSYQAFGYHLKCRDGRVRWTNWWEAIYMIFQQLSIDALLAATALLATEGALRTALLTISAATAIGFTVLTLGAAFVPNRRLLSFEWMSAVSTPAVAAMFGIHAVAAVRDGDALDWALAATWIGLAACMVAYLAYWRSGIADRLWSRGRWFSENDVLHVTLILWVLGIAATGPLFVDRLTI